MTTGTKPAKSSDWVSQRPFWGGLLLFLAGFELFLSSNLNLGDLQVHFGPSGFLSYLLPAMLLLCGVLAVVSPGQRLFYGIVGLLTALFSLIGLNLGGFFLGMVLGLVGGALTVAWAPTPPAAPQEEPEGPEEAEESEGFPESTVDNLRGTPTLYGTPAVQPDPEPFEAPSYSYEADVPPAPREGLLTDSLPSALRSPLHAEKEPTGAPDGGAGGATDPDPDGPLPRRRSPYLGGFLVLVMLGAAAYGATTRSSPAFAVPPCATPTRSAGTGPTGTPTKAPTTAPPAATPSAGPSPSGTDGGNVVSDILHGIIGILTGGGNKAAPASTPTPTPSPAGAPTTTVAPAPAKSLKVGRTPGCIPSASASPTPPKRAALAAGQPYVSDPPSTMITQTLTMSGLSYDGVVNLPTKTGSIAVLKFSMSKSVSTPFELDSPADSKTLFTRSSSLTVAGNVSFYTSSFHGNVLGLIPMTFTPSQPPPLILPELFFTDCTIKLVFVQSDLLAAPGLAQNY